MSQFNWLNCDNERPASRWVASGDHVGRPQNFNVADPLSYGGRREERELRLSNQTAAVANVHACEQRGYWEADELMDWSMDGQVHRYRIDRVYNFTVLTTSKSCSVARRTRRLCKKLVVAFARFLIVGRSDGELRLRRV